MPKRKKTTVPTKLEQMFLVHSQQNVEILKAFAEVSAQNAEILKALTSKTGEYDARLASLLENTTRATDALVAHIADDAKNFEAQSKQFQTLNVGGSQELIRMREYANGIWKTLGVGAAIVLALASLYTGYAGMGREARLQAVETMVQHLVQQPGQQPGH